MQIWKYLKAQLARLLAWGVRFHTLALAEWTFRDFPTGRILKRPFYNYKIHVDVSRTNTQRLLFLEGTRFVEERLILEPLLHSGMTVVDVGANIGYHTLFFAHHVGSRGSVIAFEPDPRNLRELRMNCDANNLSQVSVIEAAVGDRTGTIGFRPGLNGTVDESSDQSVQITTIDAALTDESVDFVKIDVEGFEMSVLRGMKTVISQDHPTLFVEVHPSMITSQDHQSVIKIIQNFYDDIKYYRIRDNFKQKLTYRYMSKSPFLETGDLKTFREKCADDERYWILATY